MGKDDISGRANRSHPWRTSHKRHLQRAIERGQAREYLQAAKRDRLGIA